MNVPQRKPRDKEKIRQQYLANLQLENSNNTLNLNASKMYRATGASSQVATVMTGTEKLAGLEGLKQIGADFLVSARFANPLSAKEAVDKMTPDEVKFLNEYNVFISGNFKGRNVPSTVIVNYIRKLKKTLEETDGVDYGIQQSRGAGILLTGSNEVYSSADISEVSRHMGLSGIYQDIYHRVLDLMNKINRQCLKADQLQKAQQEGPEQLALAQKANSQYRENTPTVEDLIEMADSNDGVGMVNALLGAGTMSDIMAVLGVKATEGPVARGAPPDEGSGVNTETPADKGLERQMWIEEEYNFIASLRASPLEMKYEIDNLKRETGVEIETNEDIKTALGVKFDQGAPPFVAGPAPSAPIPGGGGGAGGEPVHTTSMEHTPTDLTATSATASAVKPTPAQTDPTEPLYKECENVMELFKELKEKGGASPDNTPVLREVKHALEHLHHYCQTQGFNGHRPDGLVGKMNISGLTVNIINAMEDYVAQLYKGTEPFMGGKPKPAPSERSVATTALTSGSGLTGRGLGRNYEKPKPYKQFGRHLIHRHKLDDGILMIKYPSGARHPEMPAQKISEDLTKVFKEMADGKMPQYHHFQGLSVKDKEILHRVVRHTQFKDMEVPPPDKEAMDKELDRFEILKGEIEAGNDNKEIIKEFKVMLMKFMRKGRIPKAQVNEIMEHLLMMGH